MSDPRTNDETDSAIALVVAADRAGGIGYEGGLPWHLPADLQFFKRVTRGHPVVMGRKTHESIGRCLPQRTNIVVSRDPDYRPWENAQCVESLAAALAAAARQGAGGPVMVIGGEEIFRQALDRARILYLTRIDASFPADTFLPEIDWSAWDEVWREDHEPDDRNPVPYSFIRYERP